MHGKNQRVRERADVVEAALGFATLGRGRTGFEQRDAGSGDNGYGGDRRGRKRHAMP